jgi:hypothetical protein
LQQAITRGRPGKPVIREHDAVSDENFIFNGDSLTDKRVRRNLAARAYLCSCLDLDECTDPGLIADHTAIKVHQVRMKYPDVAADLNVLCDRH